MGTIYSNRSWMTLTKSVNMIQRFSWMLALLLAVGILSNAACARAEPSPTSPAAPALAASPTPTRALQTVQSTPTPARLTQATPTPRPTETPIPKAQAKYGGTFSLSQSAGPFTFDLHQQFNIVNLQVTRPAYDNLVTYELGTSGRVIPELAESWEVSADGKVYVFRLHRGVKWQDGKPFTAEDVVFSINRWRDPPKGILAPRQTLFTSIASVEALDPFTVRLTLKEPEVAILSKMGGSYLGIMPKHVIEERGHMNDVVMGTGPFRFKRFVSGSLGEFEKNQDYWVKGRPYLDNFISFIVPDSAAAQAAFRTRRLDAISGEPEVISILRRSQPDLIATRAVQNADTLWFHSGKEPFTDVRVRRALFLIYDRQRAVQIVSNRDGIPGGVGPSESPWGLTLEERLKLPGWRQPKTQDIAEAKRLLAEAGYSQGFSFAMTVRRTSDAWVKHATFIVDEFKPYGITATLDLVDTATHVQRQVEGALQAHPTSSAWTYPDPDGYLIRYYACEKEGLLALGFCDPELEKLFAQMRVTADFNKRNDIYQKAELRIYELAPGIQAYFRNTYLATQSYVRNYPPGPTVQEFRQHRDVWLDK